MKKYSIGINGLRGICSIVIALFHFELYFSFGKNKILSSGYIAVEFFFLLSGFLLCKKYYEKNNKKIIDEIKTKVKKIYPAYITALILLISVYVIKWYNFNYLAWINQTGNNSNVISEIFLLQSLGVNGFNYVNGPAWYVSSLILSTIIIMIIYNVFNKKSNIVLLILSIVLYLYFFIFDYSMSPNYYILGILPSAILRGLAGMSLGSFLYFVTKKYSSKISKININLYNIIELLLFVAFMGLLIYREPNRLNYLFFIPSSLLIIFLFSREGILDTIFNFKLFSFLGLISYEFYIFQSPCSNIIRCWFSNIKQPYVTIIYLLLNLTIAIIFYLIYNKFLIKCKGKEYEV